MFLKRLRRDSAAEAAAAAAAAAAAPIEGTEPCTERGCGNANGAPCAYADRRGSTCATAWCPEHQVVFEKQSYCRRHAGVMHALSYLPPNERQPPDVGNRAASLCEWTSAALDERMRAILTESGVGGGGALLVVDPLTVSLMGTPRIRTWVHSWKVVDQTGTLLKIAIEVTEANDDTVIARVGAYEAERVVPSWIADRRAGTLVEPPPDWERRETFQSRLIDSITAAVANRRF